MNNVSSETQVIEYRLRSLDNYHANQESLNTKKVETPSDMASIVKFVGNAYNIIYEYCLGNTLRLEIAHHKLPKELTIVEIINSKYLIADNLQVYLIILFKPEGALGVVPYYHYYQSPYLRESERFSCADTVIYCDGCGKIIEY